MLLNVMVYRVCKIVEIAAHHLSANFALKPIIGVNVDYVVNCIGAILAPPSKSKGNSTTVGILPYITYMTPQHSNQEYRKPFGKSAMIRTVAAAVITMLLATPASSLASSKDEKTAAECDKYLAEMSTDLDTLEALVPNVPSDEASYLEKEYSAAINVKAVIRIAAVEQRPFFPAWNLHNAFDSAREELKLSQQINGDKNLKLKIEMASYIPYRMANAKIAWDKFGDADNGKILTLQQIGRGAEKSGLLIGTPGLYIWCLASFIPEAK
jgi:hypothetical protein